ncbi:acyl-coenzyme A thioesterase 9, mitochondrial [Drosophila ficusphila]|uniref:acyl-coenzyme A thioesterase 9, mitochondrial n=1 Tax=Drosophila ficusphila TaxID=30025 RepID=UPI0007E65BFD|nr:acyl-coenzyme A thioesterase 9, mitochondrial [Drosophila ficusphila]
MHLRRYFRRRSIVLRSLMPQLRTLRHLISGCSGEQLESGHFSGTMADVAKKIRENVGVEGGYHAIPKSREGLLKFQPKLSELPVRSMKDSHTTAKIPLESDALLRERFVYAHGRLRMGRMLEELDLLAVWICYRHVHLPNLPEGVPLPYTFVTLLVDHALFLGDKFKVDVDVSLSGHVSCTQNSSMEVTAHVSQNGLLLAKAIFLMEACNATNSGPAPVNPLNPCDGVEECIHQKALDRQKQRADKPFNSEANRQPTKEEEQIMYEVFTRTKGIEGPMDEATLPPNCRWMSQWSRSTLLHPFPQHRNESNTIFGGFILRNAIELSFMTACLFGSDYTCIRFISDVTFTQQIPVHSYIKLRAHVVYTHENYIQLIAMVEAIDGNHFTEVHCNSLHLTYSCSKKLPEVLPSSYHEALWYLSGRRHFQRFLESVSPDDDVSGSEIIEVE